MVFEDSCRHTMAARNDHLALSKFAQTRDETAFAEVVREFGGLVFNGALRRTGDRQLAEEISQNVFAIAARKARGLVRHPQLKGWFHTTTRLEASKAMQSRRRYAKRIDTLAEEMKTHADPMTVEERETWRDALPLLDESLDRLSAGDRELLYGRFFQDQSFRDLAVASGRSEAACKMRLKRALEKLNRWLSGRGATLSMTALATGMATEFSKAAPASASASMSSGGLAAAPAVGVTTIVTNTLYTMSTIKTTCLAAAVVIALGLVPVAVQQTKATNLKHRVTELREQVAANEVGSRRSIREREGSNIQAAGAKPVAQFLDNLNERVDADELIEALVASAMVQDMGKMMRLIFPLTALSPDEGQQLLADVQASSKNEQMKEMAVQMLSMIVNQPGGSPGESLDRNLANGVIAQNLAGHLREWAKQDPAAAVAWFESRREAGQLEGTGVNDSPERYLLAGLVGGLASTDPDRAFAIVEGADPADQFELARELSGTLATDKNNRARLLEMIAGIENPAERGQVTSAAADTLARRGKMDEALGLVQAANLHASVATDVIASMAAMPSESNSMSWEERVAWAIENSPEEMRVPLIGSLTSHGSRYFPSDEISQWVDSLPTGAQRDAALSEESGALTMNGQSELALKKAQAIGDAGQREDRLRRIFVWVNSQNADAARQLAEENGLKVEDYLRK